MFDDDPKSLIDAPSKLRKQISREGSTSAPFLWDKCSPAELIQWYQEIREHLPPTSLSKMNMEEELLLQFHTLNMLQTEVINNTASEVREKVQVANAVTTSISKVMALQVELYSSERFKAVELLLIRVLKDLPEESAAKFIEGYEKILAAYAPEVS